MKILLTLPLLVPLVAAVAALLAGTARTLARACACAGAAGLLAAGIALFRVVWRDGIQSVQIGAWPFPYGITLVADLLSATLVVLAGLMATVTVVYSLDTIDRERETFGYYPLLLALFVGIVGAFLTGDLFNLFVWFELALIASFVLMALGGERAQLEGALKYVVLNLIASALLLVTVGILYGISGTLNLAEIARTWHAQVPRSLGRILAALLLVAFGIKAAAFPLFFWLPASYHTAPVAVSAAFAGLLTKLGVYALLRVFTLLLAPEASSIQPLLLAMAGLTMVTGVLGAIAQNDIRRVLAFHSISQVGYMIFGIALGTPLAWGGVLLFMVHHAVVKTNLFFISGIVRSVRNTEDTRELGGLLESNPGVACLFLVSALSLAGVPPLSGFFAKLVLLRAGLEEGQRAIVATALVVSLLTLVSMTKVWSAAYWGSPRAHPTDTVPMATTAWRARRALMPVIMLASLALAMGIAAEPIVRLCVRAGEDLGNKGAYIRAVSGGQP